ncbi:MAG: tyrosine-type recombinase/integrase [Ferruginibacter sp.]
MTKPIIQQAVENVPGFKSFIEEIRKHILINGGSNCTYIHYSRCLGKIALYFNQVPTTLSIKQIETFLYSLKKDEKMISENYFKFYVVSLRVAFRIEGKNDLRLQLPTIKGSKKLPVVLSKQEVFRILNVPLMPKHRILIALLYGCGLRCSEAKNIRVTDLDFDRSMLHVRQGKGNKDRYLPLGKFLHHTLSVYIQVNNLKRWLFSGASSKGARDKFDRRVSSRTIQYTVRLAAKHAGITKDVNVHTLRHSYATHLLEDGLDIYSIKELLGHSNINTTIVYLHITQHERKFKFSPIDKLEGIKLMHGIQCKLPLDYEQ